MVRNVSFSKLNPPLIPKIGHILRVVGVARISTDHQDTKSLDDQEALYRRWLDQHAGGEYDLRMISSRGSGEILDRKELAQLSDLIESGTVDLVLAEDLGRIVRRIQAIAVCEQCEDCSTRLIAINDNVDTARDDWRLSSMFATMRHESYNKDTSRRIRRSLQNRFRQGGVLRTPLFCYRQSDGAKHDTEVEKIPEMEPIVEGIFRRLEGRNGGEDGWSYSEVADWLNDQKIPPGGASRLQAWTGAKVRDFVMNPILKGVRVRNRKWSVRINSTGRRRSVAAPAEELIERPVPHLSFIDPSRYDRLIAKLRERGEKYGVPKRRLQDPRKNRPKKRTRFPGQLVFCGICGRPFVFGGHGQRDHLMCQGARIYRCWNAITFDATLAATRISEAVFDAIGKMPDFEPAMVDLIRREAESLTSDRSARRQRVQCELAKLEREQENVLNAIRAAGHSPALLAALQDLESRVTMHRAELSELETRPSSVLQLPAMDVIRREALDAVKDLAVSSYEFAREMRRLVHRIDVHPVRLCDGGHLGLRAVFTVSLDPFLPKPSKVASLTDSLRRELRVDLFEMPQRAAYRERVVALRSAGRSGPSIAQELGLTITAVNRAAKLERVMVQQGLIEPYLLLTEPPADYPKLRRHFHQRYRFEPLLPNNDP